MLLILCLPAELEFLNSSGQVEINTGQSGVCLSISPIDDRVVEDNKTFSIVLRNTSDSALILPQESSNITILSDDCKKYCYVYDSGILYESNCLLTRITRFRNSLS